jgi:VWFA-related protein
LTRRCEPGRIHTLLVCLATVTALLGAPFATIGRGQTPSSPVYRGGTELVLVNVVVRDKSGTVVRGLTRDDFTVAEDNKLQTITSFDFEELDRAPAAAPPPGGVLAGTLPGGQTRAALPATNTAGVDLHGRRLIVLFFDLSSMQPDETQRAVKAAHEYLDRQLTPADLVAVASFATALRVDQDFTADKPALGDALDRLGGAAGQGFEEGTTGDAEGTPDTGAAFVADDTEFNIFNTDRRLDALRSLADALGPIEQKKSVIYFSNGMNQSGTDNQVQLRRTIDRAVRANVSIYAADMRGLQALPPGGEATQQSARGQSPFSGATVTAGVSRLAATQDTLVSMAEDTGGRAFFDTNAFGKVFDRVLEDTSAYYVLGYSSTNPARDGKYRHISVRVRRADVKLEYRSGYYAARDFAHSTREDREQQLEDQLVSDLSATDLSTYVTTGYFRVGDNRFFVPVSVVVPGYQVPLGHTTDTKKATLDVLGVVRDARRRPVARIRDTMKLAADPATDLTRKTVQYETGVELPPGSYRLKVVVRENIDGTFGSYEHDIVVPDLLGPGLKTSSVVVGTQLVTGTRGDQRNPLVRQAGELVPNVTRVVSSTQHLYFYYEVYDPARAPAPQGAPVKVVTSIAFFRGKTRAFETPPFEATELAPPDRKKTVFQFDLPAGALRPGLYTCQVNIVDDVAGSFAFPRMQLYVKP